MHPIILHRWKGGFLHASYYRMMPYIFIYVALTLIYTLILQRYESLTNARCKYIIKSL